jgi:glycerol-3-phosphate dehydrogenase
VDAFRDGRFDLLIVGGGITGAGVALDAVLNGWRVALIDKGDFASATSSASSKLVHGGLRYLEYGDFRLVYEALHERRLLLQNAAHLVHPLRFVIPFYDGSRLPPWKWRAGLTLYDLLAGASNIRRSRPLHARQLRHEFPALKAPGLAGGGEYYDAQMDDARLCLAVMRTAALHGACVANYVEATAFLNEGGRIVGVRAVDRIRNDELIIHAQQVLNATGPSVDAVCRLAGDHSGAHLQPTKGVHVIAPPRGLTAAFLLLHPGDGRVFFVMPWMGTPVSDGSKHAVLSPKTLIGTTDTHFREGMDTLDVTLEEIEYLLKGFNHYFTPSLKAKNVLSSFAGLRPLIRFRPGEPSSLSREFKMFTSPSGLVSVAGGKYTTYRRMAEVITKNLAGRLGRRHHNVTHNFRVDGAPHEPWSQFEPAAVADLIDRFSLPELSARHLVYRYGGRAPEVCAYIKNDSRLSKSIVAGEPDLRVEFAYQRENEMAIYLPDFLLRRTRLGLFHPELLHSPPDNTKAL